MGRCTGSSYCTACTNCSRCKYCNSGGSCGVCSGGSRRTNTKTSTTKNNSYYYRNSSSKNTTNSDRYNTVKSYFQSKTNSLYSSEIYNLPSNIYSEYYLKTLMVNTIILNLRKGPSTNYMILKRLNKYQKLVFLAMKGDWVKVRVKSNSIIGFVHYKYIVVLNE